MAPRPPSLSRYARLLSLPLFAGMTLAGCSSESAPVGPDLAKGGNVPPVTVTQQILQFTSPSSDPLTLTAETGSSGMMAAETSDPSCATVSPESVRGSKIPGTMLYSATFTVTPVGLGVCTVTISNLQGKQVGIRVEVLVPWLDLRPRTFVANTDHTCGLDVNGLAWCWGRNDEGQLGDGTRDDRGVPTPVSPPIGGAPLVFMSLAVGLQHTCGVTAAGVIWCWGSNDIGQLGNGESQPRLVPTAIAPGPSPPADGYMQVAAGQRHTCGLTPSGGVWCWGLNATGQLGDGSLLEKELPTGPVIGAPAFGSLEAGGETTCGLTAGGEAYCWGDNIFGQVGNGGSASVYQVPEAVAGPEGGPRLLWAALAVGSNHTCGLTIGGASYCWGFNFFGELGDGSTTNRGIPTATGGPDGVPLTFQRLATANDHGCGTAPVATWCWGGNRSGQVGDGTTVDQLLPVQVASLTVFELVAPGLDHTCAVAANGAASCWGDNLHGQLGNGTTTNSLTPVAVTTSTVFQVP